MRKAIHRSGYKKVYPEQAVDFAIKTLQERLEEGDVITIWKDEFQIKLKDNMPTNYDGWITEGELDD